MRALEREEVFNNNVTKTGNLIQSAICKEKCCANIYYMFINFTKLCNLFIQFPAEILQSLIQAITKKRPDYPSKEYQLKII